MIKLSMILVLLCTLFACNNNSSKSDAIDLYPSQEADSVYIPKYAHGYKIFYHKKCKVVEVINPWQKGELLGRYVLSNNSKGQHIPTPVKSWAVFSSTQVCYAEKLDVLNSITAVAEPQFINNEFITNRLQKGEIRTVGMATTPDAEVLLAVSPQLVMVSPYKNESYSLLKSLDFNVVYNASYMENTPLGRAEWLVFVASFFNKEKEAQEIFSGIEQRYQETKKVLANSFEKPTVFTEKLFQGTWYIPGGSSYIATYFKDAGADYVFKYIEGAAAIPGDFETVFAKGAESQFWFVLFNQPEGFSYNQLKAIDERYADFKAFENRKILCSNTRFSGYFEKGLLQPDVVLKDMASLFHPDLFKGYERIFIDLLK